MLGNLYNKYSLRHVITDISTYTTLLSFKEISRFQKLLFIRHFIFHLRYFSESFKDSNEKYVEYQTNLLTMLSPLDLLLILMVAWQFFKLCINIYEWNQLSYLEECSKAIIKINTNPNRLNISPFILSGEIIQEYTINKSTLTDLEDIILELLTANHLECMDISNHNISNMILRATQVSQSQVVEIIRALGFSPAQ